MQQIGLINVDFKWKNGELYLLELGEAVSGSDFDGYHILYGSSGDDQIMLHKMIKSLQQRFTQVHFIINNSDMRKWLAFPNIKYHKTLADFILYAQNNKTKLINDILLIDLNRGKLTNADSTEGFLGRNLTEIQAWFNYLDITLPILNACGMIEATDQSKLIFSKHFSSIPKTSFINCATFKQDILLAFNACKAEYFILKPDDGTHGSGTVVISKSELLSIIDELDNFFAKKSPLPSSLRGSYQGAKLEELRKIFNAKKVASHILIQEYIDSTLIKHNSKFYDATGRAVLFFRKNTDGTSELEVIDMYWKLPEKETSMATEVQFDGGRRISSVKKNDKSTVAKILDQDRLAITAQIQKIKTQFLDLLQSNADFYFKQVLNCTVSEVNFLTKFFEHYGFDIILKKHFQILTTVLKSLPPELASELVIMLLRTLQTEIGEYLYCSGYSPVQYHLEKKYVHMLLIIGCWRKSRSSGRARTNSSAICGAKRQYQNIPIASPKTASFKGLM